MEASNLTQTARSDNELHSVLGDAKVVANEGLSTENTAVTLCGDRAYSAPAANR